MDIQSIQEQYFDAVLRTQKEEALSLILKALSDGWEPKDLIFHVVVPCIRKMFGKYRDERGISLSRHYVSSSIADAAVDLILPRFNPTQGQERTVIIGTAAGDFHTLGKKIVGGCLRAHLYTVIDAGINVSPAMYADLAEEHDAAVIGISSMMRHSATGPDGPLGVRKILHARGLESRIKLLVGGTPYLLDNELYRNVGADGWARNGLEAIQVIESWRVPGGPVEVVNA